MKLKESLNVKRALSRVSRSIWFAAGLLLCGCGLDTSQPAANLKLGPLLPVALPTGQTVTPTLPPRSTFSALNPALAAFPTLTVGQAVSEVLSHDARTLAVLTTGYNKFVNPQTGKRDPALSNEYVFLYDVSNGAPVQKQVLQVPNTWAGICFSPDDNTLYVSGGVDDSVHVFQNSAGTWRETQTAISLGHAAGVGPAGTKPISAGIAVTNDGSKLVVANLFNDSISVIDRASHKLQKEIDLRPGKNGGKPGEAGGSYPFWVAIKGNREAYVSSLRDREVVVVNIDSGAITQRIRLAGNPNKMILNKAQDRLYVAMDNADSVAVINTETNSITTSISTVAPPKTLDRIRRYGGAAPNSLALSDDEGTLYVTNNGTNSVAVIALRSAAPAVIGLIPTGWSPQAVVYTPKDGGMLYVANSKSVPGPNPGYCSGYQNNCRVKNTPVVQTPNQYVLQLSKAGLQSMPVPSNPELLAQLTAQVAKNNSFNYLPGSEEAKTMAFLRSKIRHVIYIVRENRTYDQVLGDLGKGNGDPSLTEFGRDITPNQHALANQLVTLDNFYDPGEVSGNGWPWSTGARESDFGVKMLPPNYAGRGGSYDWEGTNRGVGMGNIGEKRFEVSPKTPVDVDFLPGIGNVAAPDGPNGEKQRGYLWSAALRAKLTVRNYGFFVENTAKTSRTPFATKTAQAHAVDPELVDKTDIYFRGYDMSYPEFYRQAEWEREFNQYVANGNLPALSLVRFGNDHTGAFATAIDDVNTPERQVADNDYAIGRLIEAVANSRYRDDTLIFVVEDDCQDGPDHVDEHRSLAFVVGPYVKQGAVVSTRYSTINMLRTIGDVLGTDHLSIHDSNQAAMTDVFDLKQDKWTYKAIVPDILRETKLPLPPAAGSKQALVGKTGAKPARRDAAYWINATRSMDFSKEDQIDAALYNRVLWRGIMGEKPYPEIRRAQTSATSNRVDND